MAQELDLFLEGWLNPSNQSRSELERIFQKYTGQVLKKCIKCEAKAIIELRKVQFKLQQQENNSGKKYILKPGNHQFINGDKPFNNDNITDQVAEWYIKNYPHTKSFFTKTP